jgi:hypothetical protein
MHDYYRIAEVSDASRRVARPVPAWAMLAHALPRTMPTVPAPRLHLVRALEPERPVVAALRDEVALDFPSARQALDHARRDFADADAPIVVAIDVALAPIDLRRSARVPLCVHVPTVCEPCGGRGEVWSDPCPGCQGAGTATATRYVVVRVPANTVPGTELRYRLALPYGPLVRLHVRLTAR